MLKNTSYSDIEKLAKEVHNAWMAEKFKQGFHAPVNCDSYKVGLPCFTKAGFADSEERTKFQRHCKMCHADMYQYEELPDNIKEYDRVTVIAVLEAMNKIKGYRF